MKASPSKKPTNSCFKKFRLSPFRKRTERGFMTKSNHYRPALFLDRDGVLNKDAGYTYKTEDLLVLPTVASTLAAFEARGFLLIVITNQSGVARGMYTLEDVEVFNSALDRAIQAQGGPKIDRFYVAPYHKDGSVSEYAKEHPDRKPGIGLIEKACKDFDIDMKNSFFVGDKKSDIECALNADIPGIQVISAETQPHPKAIATVTVLEEILKIVPDQKRN